MVDQGKAQKDRSNVLPEEHNRLHQLSQKRLREFFDQGLGNLIQEELKEE